MEGLVTLKYSTDAGSTWSIPHAIRMTRCHAWIRPVPLDDFPQQIMGEYSLCYKAVARLIVSFQCDIRQFDPSEVNGDNLYVFVNKLRAAPIIHLYTAGIPIDGFSDFSLPDNSRFLVPHDTPHVEFVATDGSRLRDIRFSLALQNEYSIEP